MHSLLSKLSLYNPFAHPSFSSLLKITFSRPLLPVVILAVALGLYGSTSRWLLGRLPTHGQQPGSKSKPVDRNTSRRFGLLQVYPDPSEAVDDTTIDIVAIHGLDTQSPRTWVAWKRDGDESSGETHWLKDGHMLPSIIPNARIFTFDWNANLDKGAAAEDLLGFADSLLDELHRFRGEGSKRPLVFIASCFGGLLLVRALLRAGESHSMYNEILRSTAGIAFLGTPFRGSHKTFSKAVQVRVLVALQAGGQGADKLVHYLERDEGRNDNLDELVRLFREMIAKPQVAIPVVCFYERLHSNLKGLRQRLPPSYSDMELQDSGVLVDKYSAMLEGIDALGLDVRHGMLVKYYGPEDGTYEKVSRHLKKMCEDAPQILGKRLHGRPCAMYHVVPRFEFSANNGELELGTVVDDLNDLRPLNRGEIIPIPQRLRCTPTPDHGSLETALSQLLKRHGSIWAQEYALQFVQYSKPSSDQEQHYVVKCDELITTKFNPGQEYVNESLSSDSLKDHYSGKGYQSNVYMITGLKVARNLQLVRPDLDPAAQPRLRLGSVIDAGPGIVFEPGDRVVAFRVKQYAHSFNKWKEQDNLIHGQMYGHSRSAATGNHMSFDEVPIATELGDLASDEGTGSVGDEVWVKGPMLRQVLHD